MRKLILSIIVALAFVAPATAARTDALETDAVTKAVDMMATAFVYTSECHPPEDIAKAVEGVAVLYMQAAGEDGTNPRFRARFIILSAEYRAAARKTQGYCKAMTDAFIEGQGGR